MAKSIGSEVADFFSGQSVFLTGGTGYVGKSVIEKLLRCCPDVGEIYVLIRDKKGLEPTARLEKLLGQPIFDCVRKEHPENFKKVKPINGDVTLPGLGIGERDLAVLRKNVSVVLHSAATVKFDEHLKLALDINVEGTHRVLQIAKTMELIKAVVHVSTAYCNCERELIEEKVYPVKIDPTTALNLYRSFDEDLLQEILPNILGDKPNTYTLTKHLAEELVNQNRMEVPICIVRPSIVAAAHQDPIPGYVDNFTGMSGLLVGILTGAIHVILINDEYKLDIIPLDHVTNLILAAAMRLGTSNKDRDNLQVYNLTSYKNPFVINNILQTGKKSFFERPFKKVIWYPSVHFTPYASLFFILNFFCHWIPAQAFDFVSGLTGKKQMFMPVYRKLSSNFGTVRYFCTRKWRFNSDNTTALYKSLGPQDQEMFDFNISKINWETYIVDYIQGLKKYALKDDSSSAEAKQVIFKMRVLHYFVECLILLPLFAALFMLLRSTF